MPFTSEGSIFFEKYGPPEPIWVGLNFVTVHTPRIQSKLCRVSEELVSEAPSLVFVRLVVLFFVYKVMGGSSSKGTAAEANGNGHLEAETQDLFQDVPSTLHTEPVQSLCVASDDNELFSGGVDKVQQTHTSTINIKQMNVSLLQLIFKILNWLMNEFELWPLIIISFTVT